MKIHLLGGKDIKSHGIYSTVATGVILGIICILLGGYHISSISRYTNEAIKTYMSEISQVSANEIKAKMDGNMQTLSATGALLTLYSSTDSLKIINALTVENSKNEFTNMLYITPEGFAEGTNTDGTDMSDREHYIKAKNGEPSITFIEKSKLSGRPVILYTIPLYKDGKFFGAICGTQEKENYQKLISNTIFNGEGFYNVFNSKGQMIISSNHKNSNSSLKNIADEAVFHTEKDRQSFINDLELGRVGLIEYEVSGVSRIVSYTPIGINDWFVMSVLPSAVARSQSDHIVALTMVLLIIVVVFVVAFFLFTIYRQILNRKRIEHIAYTDELTGGCNLAMFKILAEKRLRENKTDNLMIVKVDINNFKMINDMFGFDEGDRLLKNVYKANVSICNNKDIICRSGNDDFIALESYTDDDYIVKQGERFESAFTALNSNSNYKYSIYFTTGLYKIERGENNITSILEKVTMAHKAAKLQDVKHTKNLLSGSKFVIYDDSIRNQAIMQQDIENKMHSALSDNEFVMYLQPKYSFKTKAIVGAEALVRWITRDGAVRPPNYFIPLFEKNGFIVELDLLMLDKVCRLQRRLLDSGISPVPISVNQSKLLLTKDDYLELLAQTIKRHNIPPNLLEIELTETLMHENIDKLKLLISEIAKMGVQVAIDDFGTGYSSLTLLKDVCADVLKLDREFLAENENNKRGETVISSVIDLAKRLDMTVLAEGVETAQQSELLAELCCDVAQGYLFSRPISIEDFITALTER